MKTLLNSFIIAISFLQILVFQGCNKESECENSHSAKLVNMTGLDGCGWMVELDDGSSLEPTNLNDFNLDLKENKKIWISYHTAPQLMSICMAGEIVTIDCISER